jgi:hypothetical protein
MGKRPPHDARMFHVGYSAEADGQGDDLAALDQRSRSFSSRGPVIAAAESGPINRAPFSALSRFGDDDPVMEWQPCSRNLRCGARPCRIRHFERIKRQMGSYTVDTCNVSHKCRSAPSFE